MNMFEPATRVQKETIRRLGRGKVRLFCRLEEAGCPAIFKEACRKELDWIRNDLIAYMDHHADGQRLMEKNPTCF